MSQEIDSFGDASGRVGHPNTLQLQHTVAYVDAAGETHLRDCLRAK
jgi:hypothetical protein